IAALVSTAGAVAVQISATPRDVAARCTRVQVRPAPDTVMFWLLAPVAGPSDPISAMSTSPAAVVFSATVRAPVPSDDTDPSSVGLAAAEGPSETVSATAVPGATLAPAAGLWLMTDPAGTVALFALVTAPLVRPAAVIADCAAAWVRFTTFGTVTVTGAGPSETTSATAVPGATLVPAAGFWLMTDPAALVALFALVTAPLVKPAAVMAPCAAAWVWLTTFGTVTSAGPSEITSDTELPGATLESHAGFCLMEDAAGPVALLALVAAPLVRPAAVIALCAAAWVWFTTFGTVTTAGPSETTSDTDAPEAAADPAAGFWLMTDPAGTVALLALVTAPLVRPAPVIALCAAACVRP